MKTLMVDLSALGHVNEVSRERPDETRERQGQSTVQRPWSCGSESGTNVISI